MFARRHGSVVPRAGMPAPDSVYSEGEGGEPLLFAGDGGDMIQRQSSFFLDQDTTVKTRYSDTRYNDIIVIATVLASTDISR